MGYIIDTDEMPGMDVCRCSTVVISQRYLSLSQKHTSSQDRSAHRDLTAVELPCYIRHLGTVEVPLGVPLVPWIPHVPELHIVSRHSARGSNRVYLML